MKVVCDRVALLDAINLTAGVVANRTPRPQLTCVRVATTDAGELAISATDAEIALTLVMGKVDVQSPGEALIPADKLRQIVSAEDNEPTLTIETEGDVCNIRGADAHFILHGFPASEFPDIPDFEAIVSGAGAAKPAKAVFSPPAGALTQLIVRTLFAASRETSRYAVNGVLMKRDGKSLEMVATDGRRLALNRTTVKSGDKGDGAVSCIIPSKALSTLQKLMDEPDEPVQVAITDNQAVFRVGGDDAPVRATLTTNLVEGTFPPYEEVIPRDAEIKIAFDRDVMASAVKRAALLTNEESRGVRMAFHKSDKQLELSSRAPEMGEANIRVDLASYEGDDIEIGFNPQFITDALKVIDEPSVTLELKGSSKPGLIRSGSDFTYVVMPVNFS